MSNTGALTKDELAVLPSRKRIVDSITDLGIPCVIYEYMAMGNVESHYRHFLIDTEATDYKDREKITEIFKREITQKSDIHFASFLDYEQGEYVLWVPCNHSERLCDG